MKFRLILVLLLLFFIPISIEAAGHGPLYGMSTPTNYKNSWTIDVGVLNRRGQIATETLMRVMLGYGITERISVYFSAPYFFQITPLISARQTGALPGSSDYEVTAAWRFHVKNLARGSRYESTLVGGAVFPGPQQPHDIYEDHNENPGMFIGAATGKISRRDYFWAGVNFTRYSLSENGDRRPNELFYSFVYGIRPFEKLDYPSWDWRIFGELTGDYSGETRHHGFIDSESGGHQIFLGPAIVGLYKSYGVQAGLQFPIYRNIGEQYEEELLRFAFNFSYIF